MIEVRELRLVKAIDENGSLVRAARVLGIAQPALTRALARLEARLRGKLFERSRRGVIATDLGRAIIAEGSAILDSLERLDRHLSEARGTQTHDLNVIAGAYMAETLCLTAAAGMLAAFPTTRVRLISANWTEVPAAILEREAPIGIMDLRGFVADPGLTVEKLRRQPAIFVARAGHPLTGRNSVSLADIMAYPLAFIGNAPREVQAPHVAAREEARRLGQLHPAFPALVHESPTVTLKLLPQCDAVAAVSVTMAMEALRHGDIVALPWQRAPWASIHPGIITLRNRALGAAEQGFLDLIRAADQKAEEEAMAWCEAQGVPSVCG
ncbi:MAG: LysR family transcriptional regulator [Acetobacteraceae bacterium]|nr:LysR family transcriptional regulator [Acetobacteraceae bacterium]